MGDELIEKYPDGILQEVSFPLPLDLTRCSVDALHLTDDVEELRVFMAVAHKLVVNLKAWILNGNIGFYRGSLILSYETWLKVVS